MRYDFALLFTVLTALTGAIWLIDSLLFARSRRRAIAEEQAAQDKRVEAGAENVLGLARKNRIQGVEVTRSQAGMGIRSANSADLEKLGALIADEMPEFEVAATEDGLEAILRRTGRERREPVVVEYSRAFFPVILIILLVRSFLGEPYRIPSESMMPNLLIGDFILVNKFAYGLRLPVLDTKVVAVGEPQRGDVIVFHPPMAPDQVWIKRVIGLPGDVISYENYQLTVNGEPVPAEQIGPFIGKGSGRDMTGADIVRESLPGHTHTILQKNVPPMFQDERANGTWTVPNGYYFMMGDNRDNSEDSRFWPTHFLPERNIVGKAVLVWMNLDWDDKRVDSSRIGTIIR
jgi:signal peptidase I